MKNTPKPIPIEHDLRVQKIPIEKVILSEGNARTHTAAQIKQIADSIREFGWVNPILIRPGGHIIAGHGRLLAGRLLGLTEVPVIEIDGLSEAQCRALAIADNKLALNAGWNEELLRREMAALERESIDLKLLGFDNKELAALRATEDPLLGLTDEDSVPNVPKLAVSAAGDVWILGSHRLLCGDATAEANLSQLLAGTAVDLVFTDPPYNVDYQGYTKDRLKLQGDCLSPEQYRQFLLNTFAACRSVMKPAASLYVCHPSVWQREFQDAIEKAGLAVRSQLIWAKNTFAWGFGRYKFKHEPIFYCHVEGQSDAWYGDKSQSTLWEIGKPLANRLHPTMKPVELIDRALVNSSRSGDFVFDPFAGSGSTLIACERRGRQARVMEIDPRYADVVVRRWEDHTGRKAQLEGEGLTFEETAAVRLPAAA